MKILFTVCGRAGSKGVKNKNLRNFCGLPLPHYTLSAIDVYLREGAGGREDACDIVANSDSEDLLALIAQSPLRKVAQIRRVPELSGDAVGKLFVVRDCLLRMEQEGGGPYDLVCDLDLTSPLRTAGDIRALVETMRGGAFDAVFSVTEARRNPWFNMVQREEGGGYGRVLASRFQSRQEAPELFDMNASMYAFRPDFLRTADSLFDGFCGIVRMRDTGILDIDHEGDLEIMQAVAWYLYETDLAYAAVRDNIRSPR
ncbi:MAG: acylneuraminate cytidylyltransferase family protein [Clostridiales Family XIII bacterium]|jgi:CMP-N,N'-diacetyllegionaminic acid synthase|nr:acylneuraminate cytidylyltransferase family protein [Clostridiales Family XIII bacterium]